ncbi:MAG: L-histidine N(alpha)-methyltransferase [Cyclonatronaceae bacterium]
MTDFLDDVIDGLSHTPKSIPSRYFYDQQGSRLFQAIMKLDEYYLPEAELDILSHQSGNILKTIQLGNRELDIIELGAGDGSKTSIFIKNIAQNDICIKYYPLDISKDILTVNKALIEKEVPGVDVHPIAGNFFKTLSLVPHNGRMRLILFMGSNIGNMTNERINLFLKWIRDHTKLSDVAMIAFDLKKDPVTILNAYNDSKGITRAFNLNLLHRINRELGGRFDVDQFEHYPVYDPVSGTASSYLISQKEQTASILNGDYTFHFEAYETIQTEISRKFTIKNMEELYNLACFKALSHFTDSQKLYAISLISQA